MLFIIGLVISLIAIVAIIFFTVPSKNENSNTSTLSEAENENSYEKADKRYEVLHNANIDGTYLKNVEGTTDEQTEKRL